MPATSSSGRGASGGMLVSEEHLDDLRIARGVRQPAFEDFLACVHDDDAVRDLIDESHQVLDDEKRNSGARQLLQLDRHAFELRGIKARGKLVDQQKPWAG